MRAHYIFCITIFFFCFAANIPSEDDAMTLAAPAVAIASNQSKTVGHTAPLLPTPPSITPLASSPAPGLAGIAPGVPGPIPANSVSVMGRIYTKTLCTLGVLIRFQSAFCLLCLECERPPIWIQSGLTQSLVDWNSLCDRSGLNLD